MNARIHDCIGTSEGEDLLITASRLKRDASMILLVNEGYKSIQQLALLTELEKRAVAFLVLAGQMIAAYSRTSRPDREVLANFEQLLAMVSPVMASRSRNLRMNAMSWKSDTSKEVFEEANELAHDIGVLIDSRDMANS